MMISRALIVLLLFLNLNNTLAWDGCEWPLAFRCGDTCIIGVTGVTRGGETECKCGGEIFNKSAQMWCCNDKPCEGRGQEDGLYNYWFGEKDKEGRMIGAECNGKALKLEEPCNEECKGWGLSVKLGKHSAIWGTLGTALQAYTLNPCTKFPPKPTSRKVNT